MIELRDASVCFGDVQALRDITLAVMPGERVALLSTPDHISPFPPE